VSSHVRKQEQGGHGSHAHSHHDHDHASHDHPSGHDHSSGDHDHSGHDHSGHDHDHGFGGHGHAHALSADPAVKRSLSLALGVTATFMLVEATVGYLSGSLALMADAGHMLADAGALALALVAQRFAERPRTERSTFGYRRAEVLAAFVNGMALSGVAVLIVKEAVERYFSPVAIQGRAMLITAAAGLCVNLLVAAILMRSQKESVNVRAAFAHVLSDALGSVAAITAGLLVLFFDVTRADPVVSGAIAILVFWSGFRVLRETAGILLEAAPPNLSVGEIERTISDTPGVAGVHDLHVWRISHRFDALTAHVTLARGSHGTDVCRAVAQRLKERHGLSHVTIQPESPPPDAVVRLRTSRDGGVISGG
jgi:cobalt-zinc-cadmium efflux system protein